MGTSGVGVWGSDIGGFFALGAAALTDEMLDRWIGFGAFSTVMRNETDGFQVPPKPRPQIWDAAHLSIWRRYAELRTQLWPYVQAAVAEYRASGMPVMRHHALTNPDDAQASARDDQYFFGPDLLVAPVYVAGATERKLYLPAGQWFDAWRSLDYREADGSFHLRAATLLDGGREITLPAPIAEAPFLIRAGAVLALLPPDVETLAEHGDDPTIVHASNRETERVLLAFPRGDTASRFGDGETLRSKEAANGWSLHIKGARERSYTLEASFAALEAPFTPCAPTVSGGALQAWSYDPGTRVLTARFTTRDGLLKVPRCRPGRPDGPL
jgi:alpha-glucosidase (family GH31 glycosyl hydrolase)